MTAGSPAQASTRHRHYVSMYYVRHHTVGRTFGPNRFTHGYSATILRLDRVGRHWVAVAEVTAPGPSPMIAHRLVTIGARPASASSCPWYDPTCWNWSGWFHWLADKARIFWDGMSKCLFGGSMAAGTAYAGNLVALLVMGAEMLPVGRFVGIFFGGCLGKVYVLR